MMELRERKKRNCLPPMMKQREKKKRKCSPATQDDGPKSPVSVPKKLIRRRITRRDRTKSTEIDSTKSTEITGKDVDLEPYPEEEKAYIESFRMQFMPEIYAVGFVFSPSDVQLLKYSLMMKNRGQNKVFCPIVEVDSPFALHPKDLLLHLDATVKYGGKSGGYFFTPSRPNDIQSNGEIAQGHWIFTKMNKVLDQNQTIGVKKVYKYCGRDDVYGERDDKGKFRVTQYQLAHAPDPTIVIWKTCPWFLCKLVYIASVDVLLDGF